MCTIYTITFSNGGVAALGVAMSGTGTLMRHLVPGKDVGFLDLILEKMGTSCLASSTGKKESVSESGGAFFVGK